MILILLPLLLCAAFADLVPPKRLDVGKQFLERGAQGDYQYGYNDGHAVKEETRTADGTVHGTYRFEGGNHATQSVQYHADKNGFVASSTSDLLVESEKAAPKKVSLEQTEDVPNIDVRASSDPSKASEVGNHFFQMGKLGDYQYGYNDGHAVKEETRTADGTVHGSYQYVDANSVTQTVVYRADKNGFVLTHDPLAGPATATKTTQSPTESQETVFELPAIDIRSTFADVSRSVDSNKVPEVGKQFVRSDQPGDYQYGYNDGHSVKEETRTADGTVRGSYQYETGNHVTQNVKYHADRNGFFASSTSELSGDPKKTVPYMKFEEPIVVPEFDLHLSPEQHKVVSKAYLPYFTLPLGYPVQPATEKGKQERALEQQPKSPMMYVSFLIPFVVHPEAPAGQR